MAWSRFTWIDNVTKAVAARFNNEEEGIEEDKMAAAAAQTAAEAKLAKSANLSDLPNTAIARTNLGLGTAATHAATDFDAAGSATTAQAAAEGVTAIEKARAVTAEEAKLAKSANLSDLGNVGAAKATLGVVNAVTSPTSQKMLWGVDGAFGHGAAWAAAGITGDRGGGRAIEAAYNTSPATVSAAVAEDLAIGLMPIVLLKCLSEAELLSKVNVAAFGEGVAAIVAQVTKDHPTVRIFELINEPYLRGPNKKSNAADYAALVKSAYEHCVTAGIPLSGSEQVTLLVAAYGTYEEVNAEGVGTGVFSDVNGKGWIADLAKSASGAYLKEHVNGWCCHPYGPPTGPTQHEDDGGLTSVPDFRGRALREGFNPAGCDNWYITEFGWHVGAGGTPEVATETKQKEELEKALNRIWKWYGEGWLKGAFVYESVGFGGEAGWTVFGKAAGAAYETFATAHSGLPVVTGPKDTPRRQTVNIGVQGPLEVGRTYPGVRIFVPQDSSVTIVQARWALQKGTKAGGELLLGGEKTLGLTKEPSEITEGGSSAWNDTPTPITKDAWLQFRCTSMSSTLGGTNTVYASTVKEGEGEIGTYKFTAAVTEKATRIRLHTAPGKETTAKKVLVGIYADAAGSPGALLGEGVFNGTPRPDDWFEVNGLNIALVAGTNYWFGVCPLEGKLWLAAHGEGEGSTATKFSTAAGHSKLDETTWTAETKKGPVSVYARTSSVEEDLNLSVQIEYRELGT